MKMKNNKRGQITIYIIFIIVAIFVIFITAFFAPMGVLLNTQLYEAGEEIMLLANNSITDINDSTVRGQISESISSGLDASQNNIDVNAAIFQYGWVLILLVLFLVTFLFSRRVVEFGQGGFI